MLSLPSRPLEVAARAGGLAALSSSITPAGSRAKLANERPDPRATRLGALATQASFLFGNVAQLREMFGNFHFFFARASKSVKRGPGAGSYCCAQPFSAQEPRELGAARAGERREASGGNGGRSESATHVEPSALRRIFLCTSSRGDATRFSFFSSYVWRQREPSRQAKQQRKGKKKASRI